MRNDQSNYNQGGMWAFLFSMAVSFGLILYLSFFTPSIEIDHIGDPSKMKDGAAPKESPAGGAEKVDLSKITEPWKESPDLVKHGAQVFKQNCAVCHGDTGEGNGVAGTSLVPPPRNFVEGKWKYGGDSIGLFEVVKNGSKGTSMASFGHLPVVDRWSVVQFIRSITKNKVADDPAKLQEYGPKAN